MEVRYHPDTNDYYAAQQYICRSLTRGSVWRFIPTTIAAIFGFCIPLGALAIFRFYNKYKYLDFYELNWGLGIIAFGFIILIVGMRYYSSTIKSRMFAPGSEFRSAHKISFCDESNDIVVTVKNSKYSYSCRDVLKVENDQNYAYIFIDTGVALYIPASAFETAEAKNAFIDAITKKITS